MKKLLLVTSLASLSILASNVALADPSNANIQVTCPQTVGANSLSNFGSYIAGYGQEMISGQNTTSIYFKSTSVAPNTPAKLNSYHAASTNYNSTTGEVICGYKNEAGDPDIYVNYTLTNGKGGWIESQNDSQITIDIPFGK